MTAPFPHEAKAKNRSNSHTASLVYGHYVWLARWSDEIVADPDINLKKLAQLGFIHCRIFSEMVVNMRADLRTAVENKFAQEGLVWASPQAMAADLTAIKDQAASLFAAVRDTVPEARVGATIEYDDTATGGIENAKTIRKPHPIEPDVIALRALFE